MEKFIGYCVLLGLELWVLTGLGSGIEDNQEESDHKGIIMGVIFIIGIYVMLTMLSVGPKMASDLL